MLEKRLVAVAPQLFTANGTSQGIITIPNAAKFIVKQEVSIKGTALPTLDLEVKRVLSLTQLIVGPRKTRITEFTDLTLYTVASASNISAEEQLRPSIPLEEFWRAVYAEEPAVALRTLLVDKLGNDYDATNPLPVSATVNVGEVKITDNDGDDLQINPDGSLNVVFGASSAGTPTITNIAVPLANTEQSHLVPTGSKKILIRVRDGLAKMRLAFTLGGTTTTYITIYPGSYYEVHDIISTVGFTLYFQSSKPTQTVEVVTWA